MPSSALTGRRGVVAAASTLTVLSVVWLDVAAGEGPTHTAGLAVLAVLVSAARIALVGRHKGLFATLSAALAAQPALHAVGEGFDSALAHAPAATSDVEHAYLASSVTTAMHLVLAGLVVAVIGTAEWLLELVTLAVGRALALLGLVLRDVSPPDVAGPTIPVSAEPPRTSGVWIEYPARRGPPARARVALA